jgi:hypothetical protein
MNGYRPFYSRRQHKRVAVRYGQLAHSGRRAASLPQLTEIFLHKDVTDFFTTAPAERLHHPLRPSLEMRLEERSRGKYELEGLSFVVAIRPRKIREIFARHDPLIRIE